MCEYCRMTEFGNNESKALISSEETLFDADLRIFSDAVMELYVGLDAAGIICKRLKIYFCPMCGRKLDVQKKGQVKPSLPEYDDHNTSGLLEE